MSSPPNKLVLASASPRRKQLLASFGVPFSVVPADIDEAVLPNEAPIDYVPRVALAKAQAVCSKLPNCIVLAADTAIALDQEILGKPSGLGDAKNILSRLSGREHQVITTVALLGAKILPAVETIKTNVWFASLSDDDIEQYCATGEPYDKAGAYGIQGSAARFVERIDGSYSAVVGLPMYETSLLLKAAGYHIKFGGVA